MEKLVLLLISFYQWILINIYKFLAFTPAKAGISVVIFYYYSDCLGTYYDQTDGKN